MWIRLNVDSKKPKELLDAVIKRYHFNESDRDELSAVLCELRSVMNPYAEYRINQHTTGVDIVDRGTSAVVAMSLGAGVDGLLDKYIKSERLQEAYMADCLSSELLLEMYREFNISYARFHRRYVERYVFVGGDIPLSRMQGILASIHSGDKVPDNCIREEKNESSQNDAVTANEFGVLTPSKSVVFYAILSENPCVSCPGICYGCDRMECENRQDEKVEIKCNGSELNYGYQRIFGQHKSEKK